MIDYNCNYKEAVERLEQKFAKDMPKELVHDRSEVLRATYILLNNKDGINPVTLLRRYMIAEGIIKLVVGDGTVTEASERKVKYVDRYKAIIDWCKDHAYEQVTTYQIAEIGNVSYPSALKFINDRVDLFRKIKRGTYEIRDPKAERAA